MSTEEIWGELGALMRRQFARVNLLSKNGIRGVSLTRNFAYETALTDKMIHHPSAELRARKYAGTCFRARDARVKMPKRQDLSSILIIGAGPIVIGQACEFDYSGVQAVKSLKEEGYRVILVNSNPATIMTDPELADATYIEPIHPGICHQNYRKRTPRCAVAHHGRSDRAQLCARSRKSWCA